jgi:hypothetical protein
VSARHKDDRVLQSICRTRDKVNCAVKARVRKSVYRIVDRILVVSGERGRAVWGGCAVRVETDDRHTAAVVRESNEALSERAALGVVRQIEPALKFYFQPLAWCFDKLLKVLCVYCHVQFLWMLFALED